MKLFILFIVSSLILCVLGVATTYKDTDVFHNSYMAQRLQRRCEHLSKTKTKTSRSLRLKCMRITNIKVYKKFHAADSSVPNDSEGTDQLAIKPLPRCNNVRFMIMGRNMVVCKERNSHRLTSKKDKLQSKMSLYGADFYFPYDILKW